MLQIPWKSQSPGPILKNLGLAGGSLMDPHCVGGIIEGNVRINGHPKEQETFSRVSGYCEQFDVHVRRSPGMRMSIIYPFVAQGYFFLLPEEYSVAITSR